MRPSPPRSQRRLRKLLKDSRHLPWKSVKPSTLNKTKSHPLSQNSSQRKRRKKKKVRRPRNKRKKKKRNDLHEFRSFFENYRFSIRIAARGREERRRR